MMVFVWVFFFFIDQMFIIERRRFCYYANGLLTTLKTKQNNKQIKWNLLALLVDQHEWNEMKRKEWNWLPVLIMMTMMK